MSVMRDNRPTADVLMTSMRSMGYSFESAIADVIDNSISAGATIVELGFPYSKEDCFVTISDNGCGMDPEELFDAMKYGSQNKGDNRSENDLGRFGLGLKSASLSQCRKLTVLSKKNGQKSALIWDLDTIEREHDWKIIECTQEEINNLRNNTWLDQYESGTIVIWEDFDLIRKDLGDSGVFSELQRQEEIVASYLSLIFHRYLNKRSGEKKPRLNMRINQHDLSGLDPFLENHRKTTQRKPIDIAVNDSQGIERHVKAVPYILPFIVDMTNEDKKRVGGVEDYRTRQGFYIYRNERLIIWGTWFGKAKGELTKHTRIQVDIPNTLDDLWNIDIKKQQARIPAIIRNRLTRAVDDAMDIAIRAQRFRGRTENINSDIDYIWDRVKKREGIYEYRINPDSHIFDALRDSCSEATWNLFMLAIDEIQNALPYQQIYIDKSQNSIDETVDDSRKADVLAHAQMNIPVIMKMTGMDRQSAVEMLMKSEPYCNYPDIRTKLIEED